MFPNSNSSGNAQLFGASTTGGLFNKPAGGPAGGGLFTNPTTQPPTGGLFTQPQGNPAGTLFSAPNTQPNPLFGNAQNKPASFLGTTPANPQGQPQANLMNQGQPTNTMFLNTGGQQTNPLGPQNTALGQQPQGQMGQAGGAFVGGNPAGQGGMFSNQPKPGQTGNQPFGNQPTGGAPIFGAGQTTNSLQQQGGQNDPSKNVQGDQNKNQLTFGAEIHKKGSPSKDSQAIMAQAISQHMTIEELFRKWKKDLEEQVNDFLKLGRDLNKDEKDLYDMHNMLTNLNSNLKQLESDYGHIQTSLGGLERQQDDLIKRLQTIEGDLTQALPQETEETHLKSSSNLLNKAKELNKETIGIENNIQKLVDEVNQPLKEYNEDVNKILNSYYEALEYIELDTMMITNKLNNFEMIVEKQGL